MSGGPQALMRLTFRTAKFLEILYSLRLPEIVLFFFPHHNLNEHGEMRLEG